MIATVDIGGVAQLVARLNGIQKARGSIPLTSTEKEVLASAGTFSLCLQLALMLRYYSSPSWR